MSDRPLRTALGTNSIVTGLCGVVLAAFGATLAPRFGLGDARPLWAVAALFLGFAVLLGRSAFRPRNLSLEAKVLIVLDLGYVAGTAGLLAFWPGLLSDLGKAVAVAVAALVVVLVAAELAGLRRLSRSATAPSGSAGARG